jgi:hypothetical protein
MLYRQMERELTQGEPWCPCHQNQRSDHRSHLVEPEQQTVDIYEEASLNHIEQVKKSQSNCLGATSSKVISLYQLISQYLCLSVARR